MENTSFQSSWTLAEALIFEIAGYLKNGRASWLRGDLERYYWQFESIVRVIQGMLTDAEREQALNLEKEIIKYFPITSSDKKNKLCILLKEYDKMIMVFLHAHKLDVPPKRDRTKLIA